MDILAEYYTVNKISAGRKINRTARSLKAVDRFPDDFRVISCSVTGGTAHPYINGTGFCFRRDRFRGNSAIGSHSDIDFCRSAPMVGDPDLGRPLVV